MAKMFRLSILIFLLVAVILLITQGIYTFGFNRYCEPHYADKRVYFHTHHSLSGQWEFDLFGITKRTMEDLITNHPEVTKSAFMSSGNMHNPKVEAFGSLFKKTISKYLLPFGKVEGIEKLSIVKASCG